MTVWMVMYKLLHKLLCALPFTKVTEEEIKLLGIQKQLQTQFSQNSKRFVGLSARDTIYLVRS